jgi:hypothetical protein
MKAIAITTNGEIAFIEMNESDSMYEKMKNFIGGWAEAVGLKNLGHMYVNEDGKRLDLPINHMATAVYSAFTGISDIIVGNVMIFGMPDDEGQETSVSEELISIFAKYLPVKD